MNLKTFLSRWKKGILDMPIDQQLKNKMIGIIGGIVGLILAITVMVIRKQWGFSIFVFFIMWIQFISFISIRQQYISTKEMMQSLKDQEEDIESPKTDSLLGNISGGG